MRKRIIALLLALILTVGLLPTVALAADAQPDVQVSKSDDNLNLVKTIKKAGENYTVTLESWATGAVTTETTPMPLDIILVLDESGSMSETFSSKQGTYYEEIKYYRTNQNYYKWSKENDGIWYKDTDNNYYKVTVRREQVEDFFSWHYKFTYTYSKNGTAMTIGSSERKNTNPGYTFYRQYTGDVNITKREALVEAATNFADSVYTEATEANGPDHRIAIVTYSTNASIKTGTSASTALVNVKSGLSTIKNAINNLQTSGSTYIDKGIQTANSIFNANAIEDGKRARVMIVFTDGAPGYGGKWCKDGTRGSTTADTHRTANAAIAAANVSEQTYGATVYTIGIFQGANVGNPKSLPAYTANVEVNGNWDYKNDNEKAKATANSNRFMHLVSSNYPSATSMTSTSNYNAKLEEDDGNTYYLAAASASELSDVFTAISSSIKTDTTELNETATIIDNIPGNFTIPAGAQGIKVYTAECTGKTGTTLSWAERKASNLKPTTTTNTTTGVKSVSVTGFDYSDEWCGLDENKQPHGSKLIIEFTISHNNYGGTQPTNAGASIKDEENKDVITVDNPSVPVTISKPDNVFTQANEKTYNGSGFDILSEVATKANTLADGTNNAFVDIEVKITVEGTDYIYTISKGQQSGTWNQTASPKTSPNVKDKDKDGTPEAYEYPVTITFKDAAEGSTASNSTTATAKFKIKYAGATVKANNTSKKATEVDPNFDATVTGMVNDEDAAQKLTYTISRTDADNNTVGDHTTITPAGKPYQNNYKVTYETGTLTITEGDPTAIDFSLDGKFQKTLNSNTADVPTAGKEFELKITGATPNTNTTSLTGKVTDMTPVKVTGTEDQYTITKSFFGANDKLAFDKAGTYTYTVQEVKPAAPVAGMQYDETIYTLTIEVTESNGALSITSAKVTKPGTTDQPEQVADLLATTHDSFTITNTFTAAELPLDPTTDPTTGEVTPKIVKELRVTGNGETAVDMTFNVSVKDKDGKEVATGSAEIKKGAKDKATANFTDLGTLVFPEAGDYTYTIKETKGNTNGVTYDEKTYTLKVKVTAANNVLTVTDAGFSYNNGTEEVSGNFLKAPITITNIYTEPTATVTKTTLTEETWDILPDDIKGNLEEYGYPQFPVKENDKLKLIVDKNVDKVKLAYVVAINGKAGSTVTISDPEADNTGEWSSAADGVDNRMVVFAFEDGVWTIQFKVDCTMKIFFIKTFNRNKTTGKFDTAINTVIANGSEIDSDPTTITDKDPGSFDFSGIIQKELKLTGSKSFTGAEFEATLTLKDFKQEVLFNSMLTTYAAEHVEAWPEGWSRTLVAKFDTTAVDGSTTNFLTTDGNHLFLDFPAAGTYKFELQETNKTRTNVTYDDTVYTIAVNVTTDKEHQNYDKLVVTGIGVEYVDKDGNKVTEDIYIGGEAIGKVMTFVNTVDTGKDDYYPIIIPTIINKDTGMLNKTDHFAYVIGYPDGTVHPNGQITRAEVATIFFRLLRDEVRDGAFTTSNSYSDVAYGKWYNNPISTMSALGIITGYPDGTFKPNKPITRAEFAAIAARFDETQSGKSATFSDVIGHWAAKEIGIAYYNDWIKGYPDGTFKPDQNITRAEAMTLINRVLERKPESPADLLTNMNKWTDNMDTSKWYYLDVQEATNSHGYTRKTFNYELWRQMLPDPDWSRYER